MGRCSWAKAQVAETNMSSERTRAAEVRVLRFMSDLHFGIGA